MCCRAAVLRRAATASHDGSPFLPFLPSTCCGISPHKSTHSSSAAVSSAQSPCSQHTAYAACSTSLYQRNCDRFRRPHAETGRLSLLELPLITCDAAANRNTFSFRHVYTGSLRSLTSPFSTNDQLLVQSFSTCCGGAGNAGSQKTLWYWGSTTLPSVLIQKAPLPSDVAVADVSKVPQQVPGFSKVNIEAISTGSGHSAFIVDGRVFTFGSNQYGQLGRLTQDKDATRVPHPVDLPANHKVVSVACGSYHTIALTAEGLVFSWGWGGSFWSGTGGLGLGTRQTVMKPKLVESFVDEQEPVREIACGNQHTLALTESNKVYSCGKGEFGRLGRGHYGDQASFKEIEYFKGFQELHNTKIIKVGCGASHSSALSASGSLWVWGRNDYGQLGLEDSMGDLYSNEIYPRNIQSFHLEHTKIRDITCGDNHMMALSALGIIYFWGGRAWLTPRAVTMNPSYQNSPVRGNVVKIAGGGVHHYYCMIVTDGGSLYTFGKPGSGCLARDIHGNANEPAQVSASVFGDERISDVACGGYRVLAVSQPADSSQ